MEGCEVQPHIDKVVLLSFLLQAANPCLLFLQHRPRSMSSRSILNAGSGYIGGFDEFLKNGYNVHTS